MDRIFTACHGTQLLVIQHLRRHLALPPAREYLLWNPLDNIAAIDEFMRRVIATANFSEVLDMRNFEQLQPRTQGPARWWFESARRMRKDANTLRAWLKANRIVNRDVELWTDDPIHFNVNFPKGVLHAAHHVKVPHAFNLDDASTADYRRRLAAKKRSEPWAKRILFLPWLRAVSGCDMRAAQTLGYDVGYSFNERSAWSEQSIDVSRLISVQSFRETFQALPGGLKDEVESTLAPLRAGRKPLVLLLLFGLSPSLRQAYQTSLARIFADRKRELNGCSLAIKVHPGAHGHEEEQFFDWASANIPAQIFPIRSAVNLEFMLPEFQPDFVLAGPCGALPVVKRLQAGVPIVLPEIMDELCQAFPGEQANYRRLVDGMKVW